MYLSRLIYTVRLCLIDTCHAAPTPRSNHAFLLNATAQHIRRQTARELPAHNRLLPLTTWSSTKVVVRSIPISDAGGQRETKLLSRMRKIVVEARYEKDDPSNCRTSGSDIFGYHADFHEGHNTVRAGQGRGTGTAHYV